MSEEGDDVFDLCVIGGGINGAGIARDAAGRGLSVILLESHDLAAATSSASTKLIHGGLRYLEYYKFRLVRESLKERETLLSMAPHIISPLNIVLPHDMNQRPYWVITAALKLYDLLAGRKSLPNSRVIDFQKHPYGIPLSKDYTKGFSFADCWVDDARLVVLNAMDAARKGARILTHTPCKGIKEVDGIWHIQSEKKSCRARMIVNATGPWASKLLAETGLDSPDAPKIRMVKGSHIVVKRSYEGEQAYLLQQQDGRIVFVIPYEDDYTLIGTTEVDYNEDPYQAGISQEEITYLCDAYNKSFEMKINDDHMEWAYSGVRPLFEEGTKNASAVTRDYRLYEHKGHVAKMVSVFGGKLTTYRKLSENVVDMLSDKPAWTAGAVLPGGDFSDFEAFIKLQKKVYHWLPKKLLYRYARCYGTCMDQLLRDKGRIEDMGEHYGDDVYEVELGYLIACEWARNTEDILWRRTKLGLHIGDDTLANIQEAMPSLLEEYKG